MKKLLTTLCALFALVPTLFGANPSYEAFLGTNGIIITSNPPQGRIIIDGRALTNGFISGGGSGITNLFSPTLSNATVKPLVVGVGNRAGATNTTGEIRGLEAGANITITPNGSNYVIASAGGGGVAFSDLLWTNEPSGRIHPLVFTNRVELQRSLTIGTNAQAFYGSPPSTNDFILGVRDITKGEDYNPKVEFVVVSNTVYSLIAPTLSRDRASWRFTHVDEGGNTSFAEIGADKPGGTIVVASTNGTTSFAVVETNIFLNAIAYVFPPSQGAVTTVLTNDGFGNLGWGAAATGSVFVAGITNIFSPTLSNATIKPLVVGVGNADGATNTSGQIRGLEAGANITLTPNGSNYVIASTGGGGVGFADLIWTNNTDVIYPYVHSNRIHFVTSATNGARVNFEYYSLKQSLRHGVVTGTQWDTTNLGIVSVAFGSNSANGGFYASILGGSRNLIPTNNEHSVIAGGENNSVASGGHSFIGAGRGNTIGVLSSNSFIGGGSVNVIDSGVNDTGAAIVGGSGNRARAIGGFIGGGAGNDARATYSVIAGGLNNVAGDDVGTTDVGTTIGGGEGNTTFGAYSTISGGNKNLVNADTGTNATIGGGIGNTTSSINTTIGGGALNVIENLAEQATISGGYTNYISTASSAAFAFISGGVSNRINSAPLSAVIGFFQTNAMSHSVLIGAGTNSLHNVRVSTTNLHLHGDLAILMTNGAGTGKVLTSDDKGKATWQAGGSGSAITTNGNQFGASVELTLKDGAFLTNALHRGAGFLGAVTNILTAPQFLGTNVVFDGSLSSWFQFNPATGPETNYVFTNIQAGQTIRLSTFVTNGTSVRLWANTAEIPASWFLGNNGSAANLNSNAPSVVYVSRDALVPATNVTVWTRDLETVAGSGVTFTTNFPAGTVAIAAPSAGMGFADLIFTNDAAIIYPYNLDRTVFNTNGYGFGEGQLRITNGIGGGRWVDSPNAYVKAVTGGVAVAYFDKSTNSWVTAALGGWAGGRFTNSSGSYSGAFDASYVGAYFRDSTNANIQTYGGGFAGAEFISSPKAIVDITDSGVFGILFVNSSNATVAGGGGSYGGLFVSSSPVFDFRSSSASMSSVFVDSVTNGASLASYGSLVSGILLGNNERFSATAGSAAIGRDVTSVNSNTWSFGIHYTNGVGESFGVGFGSVTSLLATVDGIWVQDIERVKGVSYSWPSSQGSASTVLTNDGSGNLGWGNATLSGSATLDFPITSIGAVADMRIAVTGAASGDVVSIGVPPGSITGILGSYSGFASNDSVFVRFTPVAATQDPGSGTFKVNVSKF